MASCLLGPLALVYSLSRLLLYVLFEPLALIAPLASSIVASCLFGPLAPVTYSSLLLLLFVVAPLALGGRLPVRSPLAILVDVVVVGPLALLSRSNASCYRYRSYR